MATSLLPELSTITTAGESPAAAVVLAKRQRAERTRAQLEMERATFTTHWKELNDFISPRRARFWITDVNKGERRSQKIIDPSATLAVRTTSSGMMSGISSPARPWFALTTSDPELNDLQPVKEYLYEVNRRMSRAFARSNLYNALPIVYGDMAVYGTAAMMQLDDDEHVFRFYTFPIGSYAIANDARLRVRTFVRTFRLTAAQVVEQWGNIDHSGRADFQRGEPSALSTTVQNLWKAGNQMAPVDVCHLIQPNVSYDGRKIESRFKRFESLYYELGAPGQPTNPAAMGFLAMEGFDEFPIFAPRWEVNAEDVYATNCPAMVALGDIKQLQMAERRSMQAVEKMINPPMVGPGTLRGAKSSILPGDITYLDLAQGGQKFEPAHETHFDIGPLEEKSQQVRLRIQRAFYEDLFLMLSQSDRREITAREVDERHEEKLLALGPMLEQLNQDLLDPLIERSYNIMQRKGLLPQPPEELHGVELHVDYLSIMAQAQKMVGIANVERFAGFVGQVAQFDQSILDNIDTDELIDAYAEMTGIPPKAIRSKDAVAALRDARQKAQAAQQAATNAPGLAGAAKDLSQTPTDGNSVLANIVGKARARQTLAATAGPAPTGLP